MNGTNPSGSPLRRLRWLGVPLDGLAAFVLLGLAFLTCADVISREVFGSPLPATAELTAMLLPLIVFAVLPFLSFREEHIAVDLLDTWTPKQVIRPRQVMINILLAVAMGGVALQLWELGHYLTDFNDRTQFLRLPTGPIAYFIAVMCGLSAIMFFVTAIRYVFGSGPLLEKKTDGGGSSTGAGS